MIVPVILSGGEGRRLWPLSLPERPKQFLAVTGERTLLQETALRLTAADLFAAPIVIGSAEQRFLIAEQLRAAGVTAPQIILEPAPRNTAPAAAVAALAAAEADPEAILLIAPADHAIPDAQAFRASVRAGLPAAQAGRFVLFGLAPSFPATGYGYIAPGGPAGEGVRRVAGFVEKPDEAGARALIAEGALWNSGIFLLPAAAFVAELAALAPDVLAAAEGALARAKRDEDFLRLDAQAFATAPRISIDRAVMERTDNAAVVAAQFAWSDIGSWAAVWEAGEKDDQGNVVRGGATLQDVTGSLVFAEGPKVAICGVTDLIVVATPERVLVVPRDADQAVRALADKADGT